MNASSGKLNHLTHLIQKNDTAIMNKRSIFNQKEIQTNNLIQAMRRKATVLTSDRNTININDLNVTEENFINVVAHIMNKINKHPHEILIVTTYLNTLGPFIQTLQKAYSDFSELLNRISYQMTCIRTDKNSLLFKTGDKGELFYVLLKGKVTVLVPKEKRIKMSEEDYIKYLARLRIHEEIEILNKSMQINRNIYPIEEDDFDKFLKKAKTLEKKYSLKRSVTKSLLTKEVKDTLDYISKIMVEKNKEEVTAEDYINRVKPEITNLLNGENAENEEVIVWEYHPVLILKTGDTFGQLALEQTNQKRTASIITLEECHFGTLDKDDYNVSIKEANERIRKNNINFVLNNQIFNEYPKGKFETKFFNLFVQSKLNRGDVLISENAEPNSIYILKDGEYDITMKKSLFELTSIIKELGGSINEREEREIIHDYKKQYNTKMTFRISIIKDKDIIGLDDYIYFKKNAFNVECVSGKGETFIIERKVTYII